MREPKCDSFSYLLNKFINLLSSEFAEKNERCFDLLLHVLVKSQTTNE